jgi:hypothetical protein
MLGIRVSAELALHQAKNTPSHAAALGALQLLVRTLDAPAFSMVDVLRFRPLARPELWRAFLCAVVDAVPAEYVAPRPAAYVVLTEAPSDPVGASARTRLAATLEYALKRYSIDNTCLVMVVVHARLPGAWVRRAWAAPGRLLRALYTTGHPRTRARGPAARVAQWRAAWLPLLAAGAGPELHFWADGIDRDTRQMRPLALPADLVAEMRAVHRALRAGVPRPIQGRPDVLPRIVENALAGSAIVRWAEAAGCASRVEWLYADFLKRADRRAKAAGDPEPEPEAPTPELGEALGLLRDTPVFPALCAVLQELARMTRDPEGASDDLSSVTTAVEAYDDEGIFILEEGHAADDASSIAHTHVEDPDDYDDGGDARSEVTLVYAI